MIATAILTVFYTFIIFLVGILPSSAGLSTDVTNAISNAFDIAYDFDFIIPMGVVVDVILIALLFHVGILSFKAIVWLMRKIPGIN